MRAKGYFSYERNELLEEKAECAGLLAAHGPTFQETFMVHVDRQGEKEEKEWE